MPPKPKAKAAAKPKAPPKAATKVAKATPAGRAASTAAKAPVVRKRVAKAKAAPSKPPAAPGRRPVASGGKAAPSVEGRKARAGGSKRTGRPGRVGRFARNNKLLLGEFFAAILLLVLGAMAESDPTQAGSKAAVRGTAIAAVFTVLALVSSGGQGARKVANVLGLLVVLAYLVNEAALIDTVTGWITSKKVTGAVG